MLPRPHGKASGLGTLLFQIYSAVNEIHLFLTYMYGISCHSYRCGSLVPRLSAQLFFAYFTACEKKLGREPGNEAIDTAEQI